MQETTAKPKARPHFLRVFFATAILLMSVVLGSGAIMTQVSAANGGDVNMELIPEYRDVTYVLDTVNTLQRFDGIGMWNAVGAVTFDDSTMIMGQNIGANITVADDASLDDSTYFEVRMKNSALTANTSMELDSFAGSNDAKVALGADSNIWATYYDGTSTKAVSMLATYVADTYYRLGIEFQGANTIFYAYYDNGTLIKATTVSDCDLTYDAVDAVIIKNTVAATTGTADYFFGSSEKTDYNPATYESTDLNAAPTALDTYQKMAVNFGSKEMTPGSYSSDAAVSSAIGYTDTGKSITNDRYLNKTDFGEILSVEKETDVEVRGLAKYMGWKDLQTDNEKVLAAYIASVHHVSVDQVHVIDYYMTSVNVNYTWTPELTQAVNKAWYSAAKDMGADMGAEIKFSDKDATQALNMMGKTASMEIVHEAEDVDYIFFPSAASTTAFNDRLETLQNEMRTKAIGAAFMIPENFGNITDTSYTSLTAQDAMDTNNIWYNALKNLDSSFQFTDALLGQVLQNAKYMMVDLSSAQDSMSWSVFSDGKLSNSPLSMVTEMGNIVFPIVLVIIIVIVAVVACFLFFGVAKRRGKHKA